MGLINKQGTLVFEGESVSQDLRTAYEAFVMEVQDSLATDPTSEPDLELGGGVLWLL